MCIVCFLMDFACTTVKLRFILIIFCFRYFWIYLSILKLKVKIKLIYSTISVLSIITCWNKNINTMIVRIHFHTNYKYLRTLLMKLWILICERTNRLERTILRIYLNIKNKILLNITQLASCESQIYCISTKDFYYA